MKALRKLCERQEDNLLDSFITAKHFHFYYLFLLVTIRCRVLSRIGSNCCRAFSELHNFSFQNYCSWFEKRHKHDHRLSPFRGNRSEHRVSALSSSEAGPRCGNRGHGVSKASCSVLLPLGSLQHGATYALPATQHLRRILQPYRALPKRHSYRDERHGSSPAFVVSTNTSLQLLFTSIQAAKFPDTHKVFSWWNTWMIALFFSFCPTQFIFSQFLCDINSKFLAKVKIYSTLDFPEMGMVILCCKEWKLDFLQTRGPSITYFSVVG